MRLDLTPAEEQKVREDLEHEGEAEVMSMIAAPRWIDGSAELNVAQAWLIEKELERQATESAFIEQSVALSTWAIVLASVVTVVIWYITMFP